MTTTPLAPSRHTTVSHERWDRVAFSASAAPVRDQPDAAVSQPATRVDTATLPEPGQWAGALVRAAVEVLVGSRPPAQLTRWLNAEVYESLARRSGLAVRILGRPRRARRAQVRRVRVCRLRPEVAEASVVVHDGARIRGAGVRLEAHRGRWRATALEIG